MDSNSSLIQTKVSKVDTSLADLKKEISKCTGHLEKLKQDSETIVDKLNGISAPALYLHEFVGVNSFLLKYISLLTEINCKFEVMEILESESGSSKSNQNRLNNVYQVLEQSAQPKINISSGDSLDLLESAERFNSNQSNEDKERLEAEALQGIEASTDGKSTDEIKQVKTLSCFFQKTQLSEGDVQLDRVVKIETAAVKDKDKTPECVDEDYFYEIKPLELPEGSGMEFDVHIKHIVSPSEFYVHFTETKMDVLPELERELKSIAIKDRERSPKRSKHTEATKALLSGKTSYALYYSEPDEMWFRVKVSDWCLTRRESVVSIFFLDHGDSKQVSFEDLQPMRKHLTKYPALAQRCHLSGLRPLHGDEKGTFKWDAKVKDEMIRLLINAGSIEIQVAEKDRYHPPGSLPVSLWTSNGRFTSVNKILIQKKYAKELEVSDNEKTSKTSKTSDDDWQEEEELEKWNPMKEDYESYLNTFDLNVTPSTSYGYAHKGLKSSPFKYSRNWRCYKGNKCRKEHSYQNPFGCTKKKEEVYTDAFSMLTSPSVGSIIRVVVTAVSDVNQFYCIACNQEDDSEENLFTLVDEINEELNVKELKELLIPPSVGQIVLAKYSQDDCWYRAKVLESLPEADRFSLIFVDYGNKETVPLSKIRAIEPRYLHLPFQGMQCFIYGVGENPEASREAVMKYLNEKMLDMELKIEVISQFPGSEVSLLVRAFDENETDIGKDLIARGYGVEKEDIILSAGSEKMPG